jgi:hypothetical protein
MRSPRRHWIWLGATALLLGLIALNLSRSPEWRQFSGERFWSLILEARAGYLLAALGATLASYLMRAYRWQWFLGPLKKASLWVLFVGQILGFSSIYLVGRPGEFVRPAYIARKEGVPITSMVAVWLLERVYDTVMLVLLFAVALYVSPFDLAAGKAGKILAHLNEAGLVMFVATALIVIALVFFRLRADRTAAWTLRRFGFLSPRARHHLEHFVHSFADGLRVIQSWRDLLASIISTVLLWTVNGSVFFLVFRSLGGELDRLTWLGAAMAMFFAVLGLMIQFPGVGGGYQVGVILALTKLFSISVEAATGAAILTWIMISVPCLALGVALLIHEGLTFRKLKAIAEEERAVVEEKV